MILHSSKNDVLDVREQMAGKIEEYRTLIKNTEQNQKSKSKTKTRTFRRLENLHLTYQTIVDQSQKELAKTNH